MVAPSTSTQDPSSPAKTFVAPTASMINWGPPALAPTYGTSVLLSYQKMLFPAPDAADRTAVRVSSCCSTT